MTIETPLVTPSLGSRRRFQLQCPSSVPDDVSHLLTQSLLKTLKQSPGGVQTDSSDNRRKSLNSRTASQRRISIKIRKETGTNNTDDEKVKQKKKTITTTRIRIIPRLVDPTGEAESADNNAERLHLRLSTKSITDPATGDAVEVTDNSAEFVIRKNRQSFNGGKPRRSSSFHRIGSAGSNATQDEKSDSLRSSEASCTISMSSTSNSKSHDDEDEDDDDFEDDDDEVSVNSSGDDDVSTSIERCRTSFHYHDQDDDEDESHLDALTILNQSSHRRHPGCSQQTGVRKFKLSSNSNSRKKSTNIRTILPSNEFKLLEELTKD